MSSQKIQTTRHIPNQPRECRHETMLANLKHDNNVCVLKCSTFTNWRNLTVIQFAYMIKVDVVLSHFLVLKRSPLQLTHYDQSTIVEYGSPVINTLICTLSISILKHQKLYSSIKSCEMYLSSFGSEHTYFTGVS